MPVAPPPQIIAGAFGELLIAPDTNDRSAPHYHTTYAIGVNRSGAGTLFARGRFWSYSEAVVVAINPFDPHWGRASPRGVRYTLLYPELEWLRGLPRLRGFPCLMHFECPIVEDLRLSARLGRAFDDLVRSGDDSLLPGAVEDLFCTYAKITPPAAASKVRGPAPTDYAIAGLAAQAGLSRAYYSRKYRQLTGLSPLDHRRQGRVLAARLLIEAGVDLAAAAAEAGFSDQPHMTRQFRQILGVTPAAYRPKGQHKRSRP